MGTAAGEVKRVRGEVVAGVPVIVSRARFRGPGYAGFKTFTGDHPAPARTNVTLREMARLRPMSPDALLGVKGVGAR